MWTLFVIALEVIAIAVLVLIGVFGLLYWIIDYLCES